MSFWVGLGLFAAGYALRIIAGLELRQVGLTTASHFATDTLPEKWLKDGVFRLRHPMYLGALLNIAGVGIMALGWGGATLAWAALPYYADRVAREERTRRLYFPDGAQLGTPPHRRPGHPEAEGSGAHPAG